ncbi:hypothetical protein OQJ35_03420 [Legionella pneumophila]|nr:hypothetical protein [Legionella pneumophila]MCW8427574.1 hypothetical protein [Legionella pneumophila]
MIITRQKGMILPWRISGRILIAMVFLICPGHDRQCHYSLVLIGIKN